MEIRWAMEMRYDERRGAKYKIMKMAIYIRVSTEDQAREGYPHRFLRNLNVWTSSLEVQREYLESFANREGFEVFKIYSDDGISAYSTRRPALQELLADAKAKRFELVGL